MHNNL